MPSRTTPQSHRPQASDRTLVGSSLADTPAAEPRREADVVASEPMPARISVTNFLPKITGAGSREKSSHPVGGENFLLTFPFIELSPPTYLIYLLAFSGSDFIVYLLRTLPCARGFGKCPHFGCRLLASDS